jgi:hypothetical protein
VDLPARRPEAIEDPGGGGRGIDLYPAAFAGKRVERRAELAGRHDRHPVAEMAVEAGGELAPVDEQGDRAVLAQVKDPALKIDFVPGRRKNGLRKPSDAYLPASYAGPNPILFIGGRGIALDTRQDTPSLHAF